MTKTKIEIINFKQKNISVIIVFIAITFILIVNQQTVKNSVENSIKMCLSSIIPAIFPFMILSDFLSSGIELNGNSSVTRVWSSFFNISEITIIPYVLGNVCGFPLGVKSASALYEHQIISKDECERIITFSNNPSLAFIVSGVGMGMRDSLTDGLALYFSVIFSSAIIGKINNGERKCFRECTDITRQNFSIVNSIKSSAYGVISVCSYIIFFSVIADIVSAFVKSEIVTAIVFAFLEIGGASKYISTSENLGIFNLPLNAFALSFSGLSVYLQTLCFAPSEINKSHCFIMKLLQGTIAFIIILIYVLFKLCIKMH